MDFFHYWWLSLSEGERFALSMGTMILNLFLAFIAGDYLGHHRLKYPRQRRLGWLLTTLTVVIWCLAAVTTPMIDGDVIITLVAMAILTILVVGAGISHWHITKHKRRKRHRVNYQPQFPP